VTDFIVIGGGIAGAAAAAFLAPNGQVVLLEKEPVLAYHTTGRSAAMLVENYGSAGSRPLVRAARAFLESPPDGAVDSPLLSSRPVMWVSGQGTEDVLGPRAERAIANGAQCELLDRLAALERVPIMSPDWLVNALFEPSGADIDVAGLHQAFVRIARRYGSEIRTSAAVTAIDRHEGQWVVNTPDFTVRAPVVVNAAGAWGDVVARMAGLQPIGLQPMRRTAFMVPGGAELADLPLVVEAEEQFYFRPDGVQFLCSLAEENPSAPEDARPRMEDVALAIERINQATTLDIRTVNSQWTGLRTFAPDRDLVIGEDPTAEGFFWLVGQGGIGIQTSPAYGALIADLVTGDSVSEDLLAAGVDPSLTDPARFR
jgi:D-arginine dehydrogenase